MIREGTRGAAQPPTSKGERVRSKPMANTLLPRCRVCIPLWHTLTPYLSPLADRHGHLGSLQRIVTPITLHRDDLIGHLHSADHLPKYRVLPIEEIGVCDANKELRAGAIRIVRAGHRNTASLVRPTVELRLYLVAGSAHSVGRT